MQQQTKQIKLVNGEQAFKTQQDGKYELVIVDKFIQDKNFKVEAKKEDGDLVLVISNSQGFKAVVIFYNYYINDCQIDIPVFNGYHFYTMDFESSGLFLNFNNSVLEISPQSFNLAYFLGLLGVNGGGTGNSDSDRTPEPPNSGILIDYISKADHEKEVNAIVVKIAAEITYPPQFQGIVLRGTGGDDMISTALITGTSLDEAWNVWNFVKGNSVLVVYGGGGDDEIHGERNTDLLYGEGGNDTIYGYGGNDFIYGGHGNNTIYGGEGDDILKGGGNHDTIHGDAGDDDITGANGNDRIYGGEGDDELDGGQDNDRIYGGEGDDILSARSGRDALYGEGGNDELYDGAGTNILDGGGGDDLLRSGGGNNTLTGGEGNDTFKFPDGSYKESPTNPALNDFIYNIGESRITDFVFGSDTILFTTDILNQFLTAENIGITDCFSITDDGTDSTIAFNYQSSANGSNNIIDGDIILEGHTGLNWQDMITQGHIVL
jgi:Ca2+-binding RTX toxin-like protein